MEANSRHELNMSFFISSLSKELSFPALGQPLQHPVTRLEPEYKQSTLEINKLVRVGGWAGTDVLADICYGAKYWKAIACLCSWRLVKYPSIISIADIIYVSLLIP